MEWYAFGLDSGKGFEIVFRYGFHFSPPIKQSFEIANN